MTVHELNRDQLVQLKQNYLCQLVDEFGYDEPSWKDSADADEIVPDDVIFRNYDDVYFTEEDFV